MRRLNTEFLASLLNGVLSPLLDRVKSDHTLDLQIRDDALNIYYRGTSILFACVIGNGAYRFSFDTNYFGYDGAGDRSAPAVTDITTSLACSQWLRFLPALKDAMDRYGTTVKVQTEREIQQLLVRENNRGTVGMSTDYFICDVEYAGTGFRFDTVAVRWPSTSPARRNGSGLGLAFVELKFGDGSLDGSSGIAKHVADAERIAADSQRLAALKQEMVESFNQKLELGLIGSGEKHPGTLESFSDARPQLLLVLANHDPAKSVLQRVLSDLPPHPHIDLRFARATWFGYGLHESALMTLETALAALVAE
jgi:hypothetical protein